MAESQFEAGHLELLTMRTGPEWKGVPRKRRPPSKKAVVC